LAQSRTAAIKAGTPAGTTPCFDSSWPAGRVVQTPSQFRRIDGLHHLEQLHSLGRLVGLQVPDKMKPRPGESAHQRGFAFELLHVILAELAQAQCVGLLNGFGGEDFGDREQPDEGRIAPRTPGRTFHARAHRRQSLRQSFDCHFLAPVSHAVAGGRQYIGIRPTFCWCLMFQSG
jgi:hypothetical protein